MSTSKSDGERCQHENRSHPSQHHFHVVKFKCRLSVMCSPPSYTIVVGFAFVGKVNCSVGCRRCYPISRGRVIAALQAYYEVCSGSFPVCCDTGRLGRELPFLRAFADLLEILQTWVQLQGRLVVWWTEVIWPHLITTVNLMAHSHMTESKTRFCVYSKDGSERLNWVILFLFAEEASRSTP